LKGSCSICARILAALESISKDNPRIIEDIRKEWDERSRGYDGYFKRLEGKLDQHMRWRLIKEHLPEDKGGRILDVGGGTV